MSWLRALSVFENNDWISFYYYSLLFYEMLVGEIC